RFPELCSLSLYIHEDGKLFKDSVRDLQAVFGRLTDLELDLDYRVTDHERL
ncbi:hypothetical protein GOP47_0023349, partial [Adiantum capillus-veneris]